MRLEAKAPAKLNLCLYVGRRRDDGLHELCSLFQAVTLADLVGLDLAALGDFEALFGARLGLHLGHFAFPCGSESSGRIKDRHGMSSRAARKSAGSIRGRERVQV